MRRAPPLLASLSISTSPVGMKALFDEIDKNQDGLLSEAELTAFTSKRSLPSEYVQEFIRCVSTEKAPRGVRFHEFAKYVTTKEAALRESFDLIDTDHDGFISVDDLDAALSNVRICKRFKCPIKSCLGLKAEETRVGHVRKSQVTCMMHALDVRDAASGVVLPSTRNCSSSSPSASLRMDYPRFRNFFILLPDTALLFDYWMDSTCSTFRGCDIGCAVQMSNKQERVGGGASEAFRHLIAGAVAGAVSRTSTAPLETLRLRMMVSGVCGGGLKSQVSGLLKDAKHTKGRAMFSGNGANVARSAPQKGIDFFAFSLYKRSLKKVFGRGHESLQTLSAGALAGATSCVVLYPLELARSRLTTQAGSLRYAGVVDCLTQIHRKEGIGGMYSGLRPSVLGILPEAAIAYGAFDLLKDGYAKLAKIPAEEVGAMPAMVCGMMSAFTGQLVAYPLEVIARRMQVGDIVLQKGSGNFLTAAWALSRKEGFRSLYCGIVPASFKVLPMAAVSFGTYELVSSIINQAAESRAKLNEIENYNGLEEPFKCSS
eukprot:CAMPEP_0196587170 /NCGR_PEP_ID=MMETSP1081-20130531/56636_1 /TAXON_ID=36882 /ORGANISM="Pyramimonas amylifera, Strain CCMP720" /LENGTH=542 /DNA_ID=CAMNT_0041909275 /DNA_START=210 /DNA_END=1838 /DNA_ORIENTATION=-